MKQEELRSGTNPKPLVDKSQYTKTKNWRWWWDHLTANGITEKQLCSHCETIYEPIDGLSLWFNYGKLTYVNGDRTVIQTEPFDSDKDWCCSVACLLDNVDYIHLCEDKTYVYILSEVYTANDSVDTVDKYRGNDFLQFTLNMGGITKVVNTFGTLEEKQKYKGIQRNQDLYGPNWKNVLKMLDYWAEGFSNESGK